MSFPIYTHSLTHSTHFFGNLIHSHDTQIYNFLPISLWTQNLQYNGLLEISTCIIYYQFYTYYIQKWSSDLFLQNLSICSLPHLRWWQLSPSSWLRTKLRSQTWPVSHSPTQSILLALLQNIGRIWWLLTISTATTVLQATAIFYLFTVVTAYLVCLLLIISSWS